MMAASPAPSPGPLAKERTARRALVAGLALTFGGLAIVATGSKVVGGPIVALGWIVLIFGIHSFGRLGSSAP